MQEDIKMRGFGTTGDCETLNSDEIEKIEKHQLPETKTVYWKTQNLILKTQIN